MSEQFFIRNENSHPTHEQMLTNAYDDLVVSRTHLKAALKLKKAGLHRYKTNFYTDFMVLYGLVYPKFRNPKEHKELIKRINDWDKIVQLKKANDSIEKGIRLSEELQETLRVEGILGDK